MAWAIKESEPHSVMKEGEAKSPMGTKTRQLTVRMGAGVRMWEVSEQKENTEITQTTCRLNPKPPGIPSWLP